MVSHNFRRVFIEHFVKADGAVRGMASVARTKPIRSGIIMSTGEISKTPCGVVYC